MTIRAPNHYVRTAKIENQCFSLQNKPESHNLHWKHKLRNAPGHLAFCVQSIFSYFCFILMWNSLFFLKPGFVFFFSQSFNEHLDIKKQKNQDFNKKTLVKLNEDLTIKRNSIERMKRADIISKKAKEIGLVSSNPETIIIKIND